MNSIVVWAPSSVSLAELKGIVASSQRYEGERVYLGEVPGEVEADYTYEELQIIRRKDSSMRPWGIDYSGGIRTCKEIAIRACLIAECIVHTDFTRPMTGGEFLRRVVESSGWDWRDDEVEHEYDRVLGD